MTVTDARAQQHATDPTAVCRCAHVALLHDETGRCHAFRGCGCVQLRPTGEAAR